jgi:hypothetical protein
MDGIELKNLTLSEIEMLKRFNERGKTKAAMKVFLSNAENDVAKLIRTVAQLRANLLTKKGETV